MGVYIGYWIYQSKGLTFEGLQNKVEHYFLHWCGDRSLFGEWCISKEATKEVKLNNEKPVFIVNYDADKVSIQLINEIQKKLPGTRNYSTQLNESLNTQILK